MVFCDGLPPSVRLHEAMNGDAMSARAKKVMSFDLFIAG
jgi:hypothetical protein